MEATREDGYCVSDDAVLTRRSPGGLLLLRDRPGHVRLHALVTQDAHTLYEKFGYIGLTDDERARWMVRLPAG